MVKLEMHAIETTARKIIQLAFCKIISAFNDPLFYKSSHRLALINVETSADFRSSCFYSIESTDSDGCL